VIGIAALFAIVYTATFAILSMRDYVNRGDVTSFTGRQVAWDFANRSITHACCLPWESCARAGSCAVGPMKPGTWYWNPATSDLDIWLQNGSDPARHTVEAAVRIYGMKVTTDAGEKGNIIVDGLIFERTGGYGIYFFSNGEEGTVPSGVIIRYNIVRQTGTGRVDNGEYYNAIHFSEHVELPAAPEFINNRIEYAGGHGNAINSQTRR
jgi:hypothetical protein